MFESLKEKLIEEAIKQGTMHPYLGTQDPIDGIKVYQVHIQCEFGKIYAEIGGHKTLSLPISAEECRILELATDRIAELKRKIEELEDTIADLEDKLEGEELEE